MLERRNGRIPGGQHPPGLGEQGGKNCPVQLKRRELKGKVCVRSEVCPQ